MEFNIVTREYAPKHQNYHLPFLPDQENSRFRGMMGIPQIQEEIPSVWQTRA